MKRILSMVTVALFTSVFACSAPQANEAVEFMEKFYKVADAEPLDMKKMSSFFSDNYVNHDPISNKESDKKIALQFWAGLAKGAPDRFHDITFIEPVGKNKALIRWRFKATNTGGLFGVPANGNKVDVAGMELWEVKDGEIVSLYHVEEIAKLMQQLRAKPND